MAALGAQPEECLMVGDSTADMAAGRAAGVKTCAVRYGYGDQEEHGAPGTGLLGGRPARAGGLNRLA
jgi:phosphoglycolate phosphatase-like HAD superfamily hydrolase